MAARTATTPTVSRWLVVAGVLAPGWLVAASQRTGLLNPIQLIGLVVGVGLIAGFAIRPDLAVRALVWFLPVQLVVLSLLFRVVRNGGTIRMAVLWRDAAVAGIAVAVVLARRHRPRPLDGLDRLCLAYAALSAAYFLAPASLLGPLGGDVSYDVRFAAWRSTVLPIVLVLLGRQLWVDAETVRRASRTLMRWGALFGGLAVVELLASSAWNSFMVDVVQANRYRLLALQLPYTTFTLGLDEVRVISPTGLTRVGGVFLSPLELSFFLLVCFAFLVERVVRGGSPLAVRLGLVATAAGILLTQTRSVMVGALVVALVGARPTAGRATVARARFAALVAAACIVAIPALALSGYLGRFVGHDRPSDVAHVTSTRAALDRVVDHPLGQGLGMGSDGVFNGVRGAVVSENQLLDVGLQLGVLGVALFAAVVISLIRRLGRAAAAVGDRPDLQLGAAAARSALLGLLVPLWFLQPFDDPQLARVLPLVAGAALGAAERHVHERTSPAAPEPALR
jgi:hypothetical protein